MKVPDLEKIAKGLGVAVRDLLPGAGILDIEKMSMLDLMRVICKREIENYLMEHKLNQ